MINREVALRYWHKFGGGIDSVKNVALIASRWASWDLTETIQLFKEFALEEKTATAGESTVDGKEGVWRTIRGTKVFFPEGEDFDTVINERFKSPVKPSEESEQDKQIVDFPEARKKHQEFQQSAKSQSYSYDPVSGKGFDAFNQEDAKQMYDRYGNGSDPVYFISETNHAGQLSRESESAYINIQNRGKDPIIGRWVSDETGFDYTDVSYAESTNDEGSIVEILRKTNQESALKLNPDGTVDFVDA